MIKKMSFMVLGVSLFFQGAAWSANNALSAELGAGKSLTGMLEGGAIRQGEKGWIDPSPVTVKSPGQQGWIDPSPVTVKSTGQQGQAASAKSSKKQRLKEGGFAGKKMRMKQPRNFSQLKRRK